jgi:hypothetical protein
VRREERSDSGVRDVVNTYDHQHWRRVGINGIIIAECSEGSTIASHQLRRGRTAQEGARGGRRIEQRVRGSSLERARENGMERDAGGTDGEEGGRAGIYSHREKRQGSATRAFPDRAAAKLGGADRTTEITKIS